MRVKFLAAALAATVGSHGMAQDAAKAVPKSEAPPLQKTPVSAPPAAAADPKPGPAAPAAATPGPHSLVPADVRDWKGLAKRLEVMGEADLLPTAAVWKGLSAEAKAAVKRVARASQVDPADQRLLLDALNAWIAAPKPAADFPLKSEQVRDPELQSLLKRQELVQAESRRLNRLLVESMFALELAPPPATVAANGGNVSRYPPNRPAEVTLTLSVPNLRGRLNVFLPNNETLVFAGEKPVTVRAPNDGVLRYALSGDEYDQPFPRTITWTDEDVKDGVVEKSLPLLRSRRAP